MQITGAIPQLRTTDLAGSIEFYTKVVGLALDFHYEDFYAGIRAGRQVFHLYLETDDARAAADALRSRGVRLVRDVHETPWGTREFVIKDDQGHTLSFGQPTD